MSSSVADVKFIEEDLVPKMVDHRCFCEGGSREYIELESVKAEPMEKYYLPVDYPVYRATVVVRFSDEPQTFHALVKLLPEDCISSDDPKLKRAFNAFVNEEIMCNKGVPLYGKHFFPRYFVADMGKYGRPVIVVEDLESCGYERIVDRKLTRHEALFVVEYTMNFHKKGSSMKRNNRSDYRELYTKLEDVLLPYPMNAVKSDLRKADEGRLYTRYIDDTDNFEAFERELKESINSEHSVVCIGLLVRENIWFKRDDVTKDVKALDWQWVKFGTGHIDVATLLYQCETDVWNTIVNPYFSSVREDYSEMCIFYAFVVSKLQSEQFRRLANVSTAARGES